MVVAWRAATQSIVYDEAFTYLAFLSGPPQLVFTEYTANNHVLFSLLARGSIGLFGVSELALRLPSVVAAVVYFWTLLALCRLMFGTSYLFLVTVAALSLNPLILDLLSAARGYALAVALLTVGLYQLARVLIAEESPFDRRWLASALTLALAACANLAFVMPAAALLGVAIVLDVIRRRRLGIFTLVSYTRALFLWIALPGFAVGAALLAVPLAAARKEHFFFGAPSLARSVQSLLAASLTHAREPWPAGPERLPADLMSRGLSWFVVLPLFLWILFLVSRAIWCARSRALERHETYLVLTGGTLAVTLLMLVGIRWLFDLPYPFGRTGLYLIVLFVLGVSSLVQGLKHSAARVLHTASAIILTMMVVLVVRFAFQFNTTYYYDWRFDSGTRKIFEIVASWPRDSGRGPVQVAASRWSFAQSLNFYRVVRGDDRIAPIGEEWEGDASAYDFIVVSPDDLESARKHAKVVYVHPDSGATLLFNPNPVAR